MRKTVVFVLMLSLLFSTAVNVFSAQGADLQNIERFVVG